MFKHLECKILHQCWCAEEESLLFFLQLSCTDFQPWMGLYPNPTEVVDNYFFLQLKPAQYWTVTTVWTGPWKVYEQCIHWPVPWRGQAPDWKWCPPSLGPASSRSGSGRSTHRQAARTGPLSPTSFCHVYRPSCLMKIIGENHVIQWIFGGGGAPSFFFLDCKNYCELENYSLCVWSWSLSFLLRSFTNMSKGKKSKYCCFSVALVTKT